jgi:hypothetical protein
MRTLLTAALLAISTLVAGCAAHTNLAPVGKGHVVPNVSIGGPIVEAFGGHIPIPYLQAGADYGVSDVVNVGAQVHLLPLAYSIAGLDVGATWFPVQNAGWQPTLGLGARMFALASLKGDVDQRFLFIPALSGSAAWATGPGVLYTGTDLIVPFSPSDFDEEAAPFLLSPFVGYRWNLGRRYALLTELKWHGANVNARQVATDYISIGGHGALTPIIAFQRRF